MSAWVIVYTLATWHEYIPYSSLWRGLKWLVSSSSSGDTVQEQSDTYVLLDEKADPGEEQYVILDTEYDKDTGTITRTYVNKRIYL